MGVCVYVWWGEGLEGDMPQNFHLSHYESLLTHYNHIAGTLLPRS